MIVSVRNAKDKELTKLIKLATLSYAKNLMSKRLVNNLVIDINLHDKMRVSGLCYSEDTYKKRNFCIDIFRFKRAANVLKILAHEMVHVKQYAKNELKDTKFNNTRVISWKGEIHDDTFYWDQPWEIEAYGIEKSLFVKFMI